VPELHDEGELGEVNRKAAQHVPTSYLPYQQNQQQSPLLAVRVQPSCQQKAQPIFCVHDLYESLPGL
jgi:hypothetical protein